VVQEINHGNLADKGAHSDLMPPASMSKRLEHLRSNSLRELEDLSARAAGSQIFPIPEGWSSVRRSNIITYRTQRHYYRPKNKVPNGDKGETYTVNLKSMNRRI
jgi:hypothetical protein